MTHSFIELLRHFCLVACALGAGSTAAAAQDVCDPSKPVASHPWDRYHERNGNRCEGVYGEQPVSGDIIGEIASFTVGRPAYELNLAPLTLEWPSSIEGPVQVRAVALREDLLYQMDTVRPEGTSSYAWPSEVLVHRKIEPEELGVRAWVERTLLGRPRELHLPLSVNQGGPLGAPAERYWLVVVPGAPLRELEVALDRVKTADDTAAPAAGAATWQLQEIVPYHNFNRRYYAAKRPFRFALPVIAEAGDYRLRLRAERDGDGELDTESFWFVHVVP